MTMQNLNCCSCKGEEFPSDYITKIETHPDADLCQFFKKTGACHYGDLCYKNHVRPLMSKVLLIPNFYIHYPHFYSQQAIIDDYDINVMLGYGDMKAYQHFKYFFEDVFPEFNRHGRVVQFKVCRNIRAHLRGNVYVEYAYTRDAVAAYKTFHGRWYGGRQLNVEFTCVNSWTSAICGGHNYKYPCPKGLNCNFLHVFRNPDGLFDFPTWRCRFSGAPSQVFGAHYHMPIELKRSLRSWSRSSSKSPSQLHKRKKRNCCWPESPEHPRNNSHSSHSSSSQRHRSHRQKHRRRSPGSS